MLHLHFRFPHIKWGLLHVFCRTARLYHLFSQKKVLLSVKVPRCAVPPDFLFCRTVLSPSARTEQFFEESCENGKARRAHPMRRKTEQGSEGAAGPGEAAQGTTQGTHAGHPRRAPALPRCPASPSPLCLSSKRSSDRAELLSPRTRGDPGSPQPPPHGCTDSSSPVPAHIGCDNFCCYNV